MPKTILELERKVGREGVRRARLLVTRWREACRRAEVPADGAQAVYRESLELIMLGLDSEAPAERGEAPRNYARYYSNPDP